MDEKGKAAKMTELEAAKVYEEFANLIKNIFAKAKNREPLLGKELVSKVEKVVDEIRGGGEELLSMTMRSTPDNYLYGHSINVAFLSIRVGMGLNYTRSKLVSLAVAALLHDIGMIKVIDLAHKSRKLTKAEYNEVKQHPIYGVQILQQIRYMDKVGIYVTREHHERMKGDGYPEGLKEKAINEYARIIALVDVYEALTHPRPYRKRILSYEAIKSILEDKAAYDLEFLKVLIEQITIYPVGSWVKLNNNEIGRVVKTNKGFPLRPMVNVIFDSGGHKLKEPRPVELSKRVVLYIDKSLQKEDVKSELKERKR